MVHLLIKSTLDKYEVQSTITITATNTPTITERVSATNMKFQLITSVSALLLSTGPAALATHLPADIEECNSDITPQGPYASCVGFNVSFGTYTHSSYEEISSVSSFDEYQAEDGVPVTTRRVAVGDYVVWRSDDKEGTSLCFPNAEATYTETRYPDGTTSSTVEGSSLFLMTESDSVAEGIDSTSVTKPGTFYQVEGTRTVIIAADGIHGGVTDLDGTFIDVCALLSSSETTPLKTEKSPQPQPRTRPVLFGALNAAAIQSDLPSCNSLGISSRNTCTNYCFGKGYNQLMSQWYEGVCSCFPKDTMQATPVCKAGGSSTLAPANPSTIPPPSPTPPTPPSPTPPTPATCDSMGITNSDQCTKGCTSRNNLDMSTWHQEDGDSICKCGSGKDQYVLCENRTSGAAALSGLMAALMLALGTAMMMLV